SDVSGNALSTIGSGPFTLDLSTREDALAILEKRLGEGRISNAIREGLVETPKQHPEIKQILVGDGLVFARTAAQIAKRIGFNSVELVETPVSEDVSLLARSYAQLIRQSSTKDSSGDHLWIRYGEPV